MAGFAWSIPTAPKRLAKDVAVGELALERLRNVAAKLAPPIAAFGASTFARLSYV